MSQFNLQKFKISTRILFLLIPFISGGDALASLLKETGSTYVFQRSDSLVLGFDPEARNSNFYIDFHKDFFLSSHSLDHKVNQNDKLQLLPLTLKDVNRLVKENNPSLKAAFLQVDQAKSKLLASLSAWYPTMDFSANGLPQYLAADSYRNPDFIDNPSTTSSQWKTEFTAKVKWDIVDPARVPQVASARDSFEKAKETYSIVLRDLLLEASIDFFQLQRADKSVEIGNQSLENSMISLKDANVRFKSGVASKFEVLEAKTQLARDKRIFNNALRDQSIARNALSVILYLPTNIVPSSTSRLKSLGLWTPTLEESIIAAYKFREELDRFILDISINNSKANEALAAIQPILSLVNTFTTYRTEGQANVVAPADNKDFSWSASNTIGLTATWKFFDGGNARALYRFNKQKAEESRYKLIAEKNKIRQEVEESFASLKAASKDILNAYQELTSQKEVLRLSRLRFNAGVTNQRELVNNQRDLTQSEVNYADAIFNYNKSLAQLRRRTGLDSIVLCEDLNIISNASNDSNDLYNLEPDNLLNGIVSDDKICVQDQLTESKD